METQRMVRVGLLNKQLMGPFENPQAAVSFMAQLGIEPDGYEVLDCHPVPQLSPLEVEAYLAVKEGLAEAQFLQKKDQGPGFALPSEAQLAFAKAEQLWKVLEPQRKHLSDEPSRPSS